VNFQTPSLPGPEGEAFFVSGPGMHTGALAWVRGHVLPAGSGRWLKLPDGSWQGLEGNGFASVMRCSQFHGVGPLEHFAAGLALSGAADWVLEVSNPDLPLGDGSAQAMMTPVRRPLPWLEVPMDFSQTTSNERGGELRVRSAGRFSVTSRLRLPSGEMQTWSADGDEIRDCHRARTFIGVDHFVSARIAGLLGGCDIGQGCLLGPATTTEGARWSRERGLDPDAAVMSGEPLRMAGELAAHKVLDLIGDLALWTGGIPRLEITMEGVGHREFHALGNALKNLATC
jgi:hypothetical protein